MKPQILHLVPDLIGLPGGIARYCRMVCQALLESGVDLSVVALHDSEEAASEAMTVFPGMFYWSCQGSRPKFIRQGMFTALRQRPDLILVGHANFAPLGWGIARLVGAPFATCVHGTDVWTPLNSTRRWALQRSKRIISVSRFTAQKAFRANGLNENQTRILPNCLAPQFESPVHVDKDPSYQSMLIVARMTLAEQYKGHDYVIRAMPSLLSRFPRLVFDIVGDGDWRPTLETLAAQLGVAHAVRFHGIVSDEELRRLYAQASLFIMPSRGEGFGIVYLEAMAQGIPVIGSNADAAPEVIDDGETGYVVSPTSVEAIIAAVSRLLEDDVLRQQMGQAAFRQVHKKFSYIAFRARLTTILSEILPDKSFNRHPRAELVG